MKAGPPAQLDFSDVPKAVVEGEPQPFEVRVLDDAGNLVTDGLPKVTLQLASGKGKLGGTLEAIAENGVARFPEVTYNGVDPFTVKAVSKGLPSNTVADPIPVVTPQGQPASVESAQALDTMARARDTMALLKPTGPAASAAMKLEATPPASGIEAGKPFTVKVAYKDKDGGLAPGADQKVSAKFVAADGTEVPLSGRTTVSPLDGVATFKDLQLPKGVSLVGGKLLLTAPGLVGSAINVTEDGCEVDSTALCIHRHTPLPAYPPCRPRSSVSHFHHQPAVASALAWGEVSLLPRQCELEGWGTWKTGLKGQPNIIFSVDIVSQEIFFGRKWARTRFASTLCQIAFLNIF